MKAYRLKISEIMLALAKAVDKGCNYIDIEIKNTVEHPNTVLFIPSKITYQKISNTDKLKNIDDIYNNLID